VDRFSEGVAPHAASCLEFAQDSGLWCAVAFASPEVQTEWRGRIEAAFRLLGDSGIGGGRSRGWGHFVPQFSPLPALLGNAESVAGYWILSVYAPGSLDTVDWKTGSYSLVTRSGRAATGEVKSSSRMVSEGSVVCASSAPAGTVLDVTPEGSSHPVYRSGLAFFVALPGGAAA